MSSSSSAARSSPRPSPSSSSSAAPWPASTAGAAGASSPRSSPPRPPCAWRRTHGVGVVVVDRCGHVGRLGEYVETIAAAGFRRPRALQRRARGRPTRHRRCAPSARTRVAWAVPRADGEPILVDFATAELAEGKLRVAVSRGEQLNVPAVVDARRPALASTRPTSTTAARSSRSAVTRATRSAWSPSCSSRGLAAGAAGDGRDTPYSLFMLALDPAATRHRARASATPSTTGASTCAPAPREAGAQVTLPGEPEARARAERRRDGVPVPPAIWNALLELRERLEGAVPRRWRPREHERRISTSRARPWSSRERPAASAAALARGFAARGAALALLDLDEAGVEALAEELRAGGARCSPGAATPRSEADVVAAVDATEAGARRPARARQQRGARQPHPARGADARGVERRHRRHADRVLPVRPRVRAPHARRRLRARS